jgi:hypothetical protein
MSLRMQEASMSSQARQLARSSYVAGAAAMSPELCHCLFNHIRQLARRSHLTAYVMPMSYELPMSYVAGAISLPM